MACRRGKLIAKTAVAILVKNLLPPLERYVYLWNANHLLTFFFIFEIQNLTRCKDIYSSVLHYACFL